MILHELIGYDVLRLIWWLLIGVLLIGFAVMDGFDFGTGALLPAVARSDAERRVVINAVGPVWEGNQVWFILGGGAIFAAWPPVYAAAFSGFYVAMFLILLALILRAVSAKFRSKRDEPVWRAFWDWTLSGTGIAAALLFGVAMGNVLQGVPFRLTPELLPVYEGSFVGLLNPFALLAGFLSLAMIVQHGAAWLTVKTDGAVQARARRYGTRAGLLAGVLFLLGGVWITVLGLEGYVITSTIDANAANDPLGKTVITEPAALLANYSAHPWLWLAPLMGLFGLFGTAVMLHGSAERAALLTSALGIAGVISTAGVSLFPFLLPSSSDPVSSLTVWDSSASHITLFIMTVVTVAFLPVVIAYTAWVYHVLKGKVDVQELLASKESY